MSGIYLHSLIHLEPETDFEGKITREDAIEQLVSWANQGMDPDSIRFDWYYLDCAREPEKAVFGWEKPDELIRLAEKMRSDALQVGWSDIQSGLKNLPVDFGNLSMRFADLKDITENSELNSTALYLIRYGLATVDNHINAEAPSCVIGEWDNLEGVYPTESVLENVRKKPENWVIADLLFRESD